MFLNLVNMYIFFLYSFIFVANRYLLTYFLFVLLSKRRKAYPEILAQKFIFYLWPWKRLWYWNKSMLYLVTVSQVIEFDNITKKKACIILPALGKDMHFVFGTVLYFSICFWLKTTNDFCKKPYCSGCGYG